MADRPHEDLSDAELARAYEDADDRLPCACGSGHFTWDRELNRWRCDACGEPESDEQIALDKIADAFYSEIGWRSVYMQDGDESSWLERQEAKQRIAALEARVAELEQAAQGGGEDERG